MRSKKIKILNILVILFGLLNYGCAKKNIDDKTIIIGTIAGPETVLVEVAKEVAEKQYGLKVDIVPFNDYVEPNRALAEGQLNANMFQHQPYLDQVVTSQKWPLVSIGKLYIYPMGAYSKKYKNINDLPEKAVIAVPNDVTNQARSLLMLEKHGLITLDHNKKVTEISIHDIVSNPKHFQFKEVDPAFMARMLDDLDLAVINTNYAAVVNLLPSRDALIAEDQESQYANIFVVRHQDAGKPQFLQFLTALRSPEVINKAKELFQDQAIVAW
jgi:D-methionine transport system substrate-binding protein